MKDALAKEVDLGTAIHLALKQLQAVHLPFDGTLTPFQRHACCHGWLVASDPLSESGQIDEAAGLGRGHSHSSSTALRRVCTTVKKVVTSCCAYAKSALRSSKSWTNRCSSADCSVLGFTSSHACCRGERRGSRVGRPACPP